MTSVCIVLFLQAAIAGDTQETYAEAYRLTTETGRPMIVFVGTERCASSIQMRQRIFPELHRRGLLSRVAFATVDIRRDERLGRQLVGNGTVPQWIMFRRTPEGWRCRRLVGPQDLDDVATFIEQGLALDTEARRLARLSHGRRFPREQPEEETLPDESDDGS